MCGSRPRQVTEAPSSWHRADEIGLAIVGVAFRLDVG